MAYFASRSYTPSLHLHEDSHFFAHFSHLFPLPQDLSWTLALPPKEITSLIFSTLRGKLQPLELWTTQFVRNSGGIGKNMQDASTSISTCSQQPHIKRLMPSKPLVLGCGKETTAKERKLAISQLIKLGVPSARPANWLDSQTRRKRQAQTKDCSPLEGRNKATPGQTPPPSLN
jgi:hypothetical protein